MLSRGSQEPTRATPSSPPDAEYLLHPDIELFAAPDGRLYLLGPDEDHVVEDPDPAGCLLLQELQTGPVGAGQILDRMSGDGIAICEEQLRQELGSLVEAGLAVRYARSPAALPREAAERYDRQLAYFASVSPGAEVDMQLALGSCTVALIGVGGLGSWTAAGLACAGIGGLVLVDDDTVELSNLNRQILFTPEDIGVPKVDVARRALLRFNPDMTVDCVPHRIASQRDVASTITGASFVVATADWPPYQLSRWINLACLAAGIPHISAGQFPPRIRVGPTFVPGVTACLECDERRARRQFEFYDALVIQRERRPVIAATLGAPSAAIGAMIATDICNHITGVAPPATLGQAITIDLRTWHPSYRTIERDPRCPACSPHG
jgi:bacteriocin biosynthesis cyclodehydratase domain-containing protein